MSLDMILVASLLSTLSSRWPERVASLCISECLLPGTAAFDNERSEHPVKYFHHTFHCVDNLPECLIAGREKMYVEYFVNKLCYRLGAVPSSVIDRYGQGVCAAGCAPMRTAALQRIWKGRRRPCTVDKRTGEVHSADTGSFWRAFELQRIRAGNDARGRAGRVITVGSC